MSDGIEVLGYILLGAIVMAAAVRKCFYFYNELFCLNIVNTVTLLCYHWDAKRKKKVEEEERARQTGTQSLHNQMTFGTNIVSNGNCATQIATPPIWSTQFSSMSETGGDGYNHNNTLPRFEVRHPRREIRRQSDADILFGNATRFGFTNERIEIEEGSSVHSGSDEENKSRKSITMGEFN